jgi:hypothetical protein
MRRSSTGGGARRRKREPNVGLAVPKATRRRSAALSISRAAGMPSSPQTLRISIRVKAAGGKFGEIDVADLSWKWLYSLSAVEMSSQKSARVSGTPRHRTSPTQAPQHKPPPAHLLMCVLAFLSRTMPRQAAPAHTPHCMRSRRFSFLFQFLLSFLNCSPLY